MADAAVNEFIARVEHGVRRRDAETLLPLMARATGQEPAMWGTSIVGYGSYHYRYDSGREGDAPGASFSPRKAAMSIYLNDGAASYEAALNRLGPHTTGLSCLYLKDLSQIDLEVLEGIVRKSYATLTRDTYTKRAPSTSA